MNSDETGRNRRVRPVEHRTGGAAKKSIFTKSNALILVHDRAEFEVRAGTPAVHECTDLIFNHA